MKTKAQYKYTFGSTCDICGDEYERVKVKEVKRKGRNTETSVNSIPYCRRCREVKGGLGENVDTIKEATKSRGFLGNITNLIPPVLGMVANGAYIYLGPEGEYQEYIALGLFIGTTVIMYFILKNFGLINNQTIKADDYKYYFLDEFELKNSSEEIIKSIEDTFEGDVIYSDKNYFDRFDFFMKYVELQGRHKRVFYVIQGEHVKEELKLLLEYTKNRFVDPFIHVLYFDDYYHKLYYKASDADDLDLELLDCIYPGGIEEEY